MSDEPEQSDIDQLVAAAEAEHQTSPEPSVESEPENEPEPERVTVPGDCSKCGVADKAFTVCKTCCAALCDSCQSPLDPHFCRTCLDEPGSELKHEPLRDVAGVTHAGTLLTPGPTYKTMSKFISEMSDYELDAHVGYYRDLVKAAERSLDFRRVVLGAGQLEQAQRSDAKRRVLRGIKVVMPPGLATSASTTTNANAKPRAKSNVNIDVLNKMMDMLMKNRQVTPAVVVDTNTPKEGKS